MLSNEILYPPSSYYQDGKQDTGEDYEDEERDPLRSGSSKRRAQRLKPNPNSSNNQEPTCGPASFKRLDEETRQVISHKLPRIKNRLTQKYLVTHLRGAEIKTFPVELFINYVLLLSMLLGKEIPN